MLPRKLALYTVQPASREGPKHVQETAFYDPSSPQPYIDPLNHHESESLTLKSNILQQTP